MNDTIGLGINLTIIGVVVVFLVLSSIAGFVHLVRMLDGDWKKRENRQAQIALEKPQNIDNITLILIAATAATIIKGRHRIHSVKRVTPASGSSPWSLQGRSVLLGSHGVGKLND
ncbi:OadG family protein [bacterium]|nr:OadG family protein [candidate division CSSED10-310 bacterium]